MKKQILALATAVVLIAACNNTNSSSMGEKDEEYGKSFEHAPAESGHGETHAKDQTDVHESTDTLKTTLQSTPAAADSAKHH